MPATTVELFVDPACPFAWMTSRWLHHVTEVREIDPTFSVMSLAVLNEGRDLDPDYRESIDQAWGAARLAIAITEQHGADAFSRWYTAWGESFHVDGNDDREAAAKHALAEAELPAELFEHYPHTPGDAIDSSLRAAHSRATDMVGEDVGTPVISFGQGTAYFGPVLSPAPRGEEAGRMFDGLQSLATVAGFYEVKRSRSGGIDFS